MGTYEFRYSKHETKPIIKCSNEINHQDKIYEDLFGSMKFMNYLN